MKQLSVRRKAILRAIRAACIVLLLLAKAEKVEAQTVTAPFYQVNGTTYSTEPGSYVTGTFYDQNGSDTVTVAGTTTITAIATTSGSGVQYYDAFTNIGLGGGNFTNNGNVSITQSTLPAGYLSDVALYTTSGNNITASNTGTLAATILTGGGSDAGISFDNSNMGAVDATFSAKSLTLTNSGSISGTASGYAFGIHGESLGSGAISITNQSEGLITATSSGSYARSIYAESTGSGPISVTNQSGGLITATSSGSYAQGIYAHSASGTITIGNSGTISSSASTSATAILAISVSGDIDVTNNLSGLITESGTASSSSGISVRGGTGVATVTNNGMITLTDSASAYINGIVATGESVQVANTGTITTGTSSTSSASGLYAEGTSNVAASLVSNSGTITSRSTGSAYGLQATSNGDATLTTNNTGTVTVTSSAYYAAGIQISGYSTGNLVLTNSGTVTASGFYGTGGILTGAQGGNISINNSGTSSGTSMGTGSNYGTQGYGIYANAAAAGTVGIINSGTATGSSAYSTGAGIYAIASTGTITITNSGTASGTASGYNGMAYGIYAAAQGAITIANTGAVDANASRNDSFGIYSDSGAAASTVITNSGSIEIGQVATGNYATGISATNTSTGSISITNNTLGRIVSDALANATGISSSAYYGPTTIVNKGTIQAGLNASSLSAYGINSSATNNNNTVVDSISITNSAGGVIDVQATTRGMGISASGYYGPVMVENNGIITVTDKPGALLVGIEADNSGADIDITNTNDVTVEGTTLSYGISSGLQGTGGTLTALNSGSIDVTSSNTNGSATGVNAEASAQNVGVTNTGTISGSGYTVVGIHASTSGVLTVANSGTITATSTGSGYGISASNPAGTTVNPIGAIAAGAPSNGNIVVDNSGTVSGTTDGIYLASSGVVNDSGAISGETHSIYVPTDSTVNLTGSSPLTGLIKGGVDDTSNSLLDIALTVRTNYAATKADLDAAIAQYEEAYTAADGNGANVTSETVVINSSDYQWQDFETVEDNLIQGRLYADTPGFRSLGTAIDNFNTTGQGATILAALDALPASSVAAALEELSPKELEVFRNIAFDNNTFNVDQINNHLANLRDGLTGFDSSALTVQDSSMDPTLSQVNSHLLAYNPAATPGLIDDSTESLVGGADMKEANSTEVNTTPSQRWSSFISGNVILADLSNNANLQNSNYTTGAVTAGVDYRFDRNFTVGALLAYAHTDASLDSRGSSATVDSYSPGLYASYVDGGWYGNFLGAYYRNSYTEGRNIDITGLAGTDQGGTSGNQGSANFTGGYEFQKGAFKFGPVASLEYVHLAIGSIQEQGPTALDIDDQNQDSLRSLLGFEARFNTHVAMPWGPLSLTPHLSASWQHEYLDNSEGITSQFNGTGGGSFDVQTDNPDRDAAFVDVGLDATVNQNVTVFVDYQTQAGQSDFFAQSAQGGVKIGF